MKAMKYFAKIVLTSVALFSFNTSTAYALPDMNIRDVIEWSNNHPFLRPITLIDKVEPDQAEYGVYGLLGGAEFSLEVYLYDNSHIVETMSIDYRVTHRGGNQRLRFARDNSDGLELINRIYGSSITADFIDSRYILRLDDEIGYSYHFYQGRRFAYIVWTNDESTHQLQIMPFSLLEERINDVRSFL